MSKLSLLLLCFVWACAAQSNVDRPDGAPRLPPSGSAVVVAEAPPGAVALGVVTVQGLNSGTACEAQALFDAKKLGATHVVIRPSQSSNVKCTGEAFFVGDLAKAEQAAPVKAAGASPTRIAGALLLIVALGSATGYLIGNHGR